MNDRQNMDPQSDPDLLDLERQLMALRPRDITPGLRQRMRQLLGTDATTGAGSNHALFHIAWLAPMAALLIIGVVSFFPPGQTDPPPDPNGHVNGPTLQIAAPPPRLGLYVQAVKQADGDLPELLDRQAMATAGRSTGAVSPSPAHRGVTMTWHDWQKELNIGGVRLTNPD